MELDKRIIEGKKPLSCLDVKEAREFEGKLCIFSDAYKNYKDIKEYTESSQYTGVLKKIHDGSEYDDYVFRNGNDGYCYCLVLPLEWVTEEKHEKTYRPYKNVQELFEDVGVYIGDTIHFRSKSKQTEHHALITSYETPKNGAETLCFGGFIYRYTMQELFDSFELRSRGEWMPFGIEE